MRIIYLAALILAACSSNPPVNPTPQPTDPTAKPTVVVTATVQPTAIPTSIPTAAPAPSRLAEIIEIINKGQIAKKKYIPRPVLSTKDTKKLKGEIKGIRPIEGIQRAAAPAIVDLYPYETTPKNQGQEGLCTAFAVAAAMEMNGTLQSKKDVNLSERHLWSKYLEYYTIKALDAANKNWITAEAIWPYSSSKPVAPIKDLSKNTGYNELSSWDQVWSVLEAKRAVVLSVETNTSWSNPYRGILTVSGAKQGGHAVKVSGYFDTNRGRYLIIKNSWGKAYGDGGYVYLPEAYCSKFWCAFHAVAGTEFK